MNNKILQSLSQNYNLDQIKYDVKLNPDSVKLDDIYVNIDWKNLISPPPKNSSQQTINELQYLSELTKYISDTDKELILLVDDEPLKLFDKLLQKYKIEFPKKQFNKIYKPTYDLVMKIKYYYNRPRPYQLAEKLDVPLNYLRTKTHQTPSYPSGHTVYATLAADLLYYMYPQISKNDLMDPVQKTGKGRMLQGIHYKSDIDAAIILSHKLFNNYLISMLGEENESESK